MKLASLNVLIIDDETSSLSLMRKILEKDGHQCFTNQNGLEAIKAFDHIFFDLVLLDIHMPEIDGFETSKKIREFRKDIPIIAVTGDMNINLDYQQNEFDLVIHKPISKKKLLKPIHSVYKRSYHNHKYISLRKQFQNWKELPDLDILKTNFSNTPKIQNNLIEIHLLNIPYDKLKILKLELEKLNQLYHFTPCDNGNESEF